MSLVRISILSLYSSLTPQRNVSKEIVRIYPEGKEIAELSRELLTLLRTAEEHYFLLSDQELCLTELVFEQPMATQDYVHC